MLQETQINLNQRPKDLGKNGEIKNTLDQENITKSQVSLKRPFVRHSVELSPDKKLKRSKITIHRKLLKI